MPSPLPKFHMSQEHIVVEHSPNILNTPTFSTSVNWAIAHKSICLHWSAHVQKWLCRDSLLLMAFVGKVALPSHVAHPSHEFVSFIFHVKFFNLQLGLVQLHSHLCYQPSQVSSVLKSAPCVFLGLISGTFQFPTTRNTDQVDQPCLFRIPKIYALS